MLVFLMSFSSCAHFGKGGNPPEVTLSDIMVKEVTLFETTFIVDLRVLNKSPKPLELVGAQGDIYLNNSKVLTVLSSDAKSIPGFGSEIIKAKAHAGNIKLIPLLANILSQLQAGKEIQDVDYKADGIIHLAGGGFLFGRVPFKSKGALPISTIQKIQTGLVQQSIRKVPVK